MDQTKESNNLLATSASSDPNADTVFEPSIEELVNDFDDEQTLREEEALAELENAQNPLDEIVALKEESEMPLEELLAKYAMPPLSTLSGEESGSRRKKKKSFKKQNKSKTKQNSKSVEDTESDNKTTSLAISKDTYEKTAEETPVEVANGEVTDCILIESDDDDDEDITEETPDNTTEILEEQLDDAANTEVNNPDKFKIRRSHLFELYPEQNFDDAIAAAHGGVIELETLYSEDEEEEDIEEEEENDPDYVKKTIMVGSAFQAVIPGLSQYGDVLPYENEDKLIWEPSQVSEAEVEEYLLKIREIKPSLNEEDAAGATEKNGTESISNELDTKATPSNKTISPQNDEQQEIQKENIKMNSSLSTNDADAVGVVKDNEQALHLLVQCGYDFKEALRRKKLNAVPLTGGTMSLWSEEECQKFEEGIQKFGKDFLKIRQNQVRTRTMRELVQFYYLWKKSERRDHNFANADTVDHMDIYLNEGEDYSTSPCSGVTLTTSATALGRKMNGCNQNNFSIMTGSSQSGTSPTKVNNSLGKRKRTHSDSNATNNQNSGNAKNIGDNNNEQILFGSSQNSVGTLQK